MGKKLKQFIFINMNKTLFLIAIAGAMMTGFGVYQAIANNSDGTSQEIADAYRLWKAKHGRLYSSQSEDSFRLGIFANNYHKVNAHNAKGLSWTEGLNMFADLTAEEFARGYLGFKPKEAVDLDSLVYADETVPEDIPTSIDWEQLGAVTQVKNQGSCGSCWAFSATAALEGARSLKHGKLSEDLSVQQLVDCEHYNQDAGCGGGLPEDAYTWLKDYGIDKESDYPYTGSNGTCHQTDFTPLEKVTSFVQVPKADSEAMKAELANGPLSIGINGMPIQFYMSGVFDPFSFLCPASLDHGVLLVGYGVASASSWIFWTEDKPFWRIKNSWGSGWGENGYFRLKRAVTKGVGICGVTEDATRPILSDL